MAASALRRHYTLEISPLVLAAGAAAVVGCGRPDGAVVPSPVASTQVAAGAAPAMSVDAGAAGGGSSKPPGAAGARTFADDVALLAKHGAVHVLEAAGGGRVAISAKYQGRVMTSAVDGAGPSFGWINREFIGAGRTGTQFDNYGGEDRFWLGPEGGRIVRATPIAEGERGGRGRAADAGRP